MALIMHHIQAPGPTTSAEIIVVLVNEVCTAGEGLEIIKGSLPLERKVAKLAELESDAAQKVSNTRIGLLTCILDLISKGLGEFKTEDYTEDEVGMQGLGTVFHLSMNARTLLGLAIGVFQKVRRNRDKKEASGDLTPLILKQVEATLARKLESWRPLAEQGDHSPGGKGKGRAE